jgi:hypothetical protein
VGGKSEVGSLPLTAGLGRSSRLSGHCSCGGGECSSGKEAWAGKLGEGRAEHLDGYFLGGWR